MKLRVLALFCPVAILAVATFVMAYSRGPLPKHTGGFGDKTCTECHNSFELNVGRSAEGTSGSRAFREFTTPDRPTL